jgi:hypothetical protein
VSNIVIPKPQIHTGPKHQTVDEATAAYLREAARRVRANRYWGSGVSALVSTVLDDTAAAIEASMPPSNIGDTCCGTCAGGTCYVDQVTGA